MTKGSCDGLQPSLGTNVTWCWQCEPNCIHTGIEWPIAKGSTPQILGATPPTPLHTHINTHTESTFRPLPWNSSTLQNEGLRRSSKCSFLRPTMWREAVKLKESHRVGLAFGAAERSRQAKRGKALEVAKAMKRPWSMTFRWPQRDSEAQLCKHIKILMWQNVD